MSKLYTLLFVLFTLLPLSAKGRTQSSVQVQPAFWWSGMVNPTLQLVLYGHHIGHSEVSLSSTDVSIDSIVRPVNDNYLLVYLNIGKARAQRFNLQLQNGRIRQRITYELKERNTAPKAQGFDAGDVLYLLMPDRFANGDARNDVVKGLRESNASQAPGEILSCNIFILFVL